MTSKERRGLVAVAAAALLCIGGGVIFRGCSYSSQPKVNDEISVINEEKGESRDTVKMEEKRGKKKKGKKKKAPKEYPVRDPLSQPI